MRFLSLFHVDQPSWVFLGRGLNAGFVAISCGSALLGVSWERANAVFVDISRGSALSRVL